MALRSERLFVAALVAGVLNVVLAACGMDRQEAPRATADSRNRTFGTTDPCRTIKTSELEQLLVRIGAVPQPNSTSVEPLLGTPGRDKARALCFNRFAIGAESGEVAYSVRYTTRAREIFNDAAKQIPGDRVIRSDYEAIWNAQLGELHAWAHKTYVVAVLRGSLNDRAGAEAIARLALGGSN